ncbi:MAG: hypothetical protein ABSG43_09400 [Solirubrobacteraceae bacterium]|jgi:hypothetical protein
MGAVTTMVLLGCGSEFGGRAFRSVVTGERLGFLDVFGEGAEAAIFGPPAALRRLALEAVRVAEDAERLDPCGRVEEGA